MRRRYNTEEKIDYKKYKMNYREYLKYTFIISGVAGIFSYIFYKSVVAYIIFMTPFYFYFKGIKRYLAEKRTQEFTMQFKEFCLSLSAQLMAGYSLENAIKETYRELSQIYGKKSYICSELSAILSKLKIGIVIEKCFEELAIRSDIEEINLFAEIIKIAKRSGGDMIGIVRNAGDSISQKLEVEREIRVIMNGRKYEQMVMNVVPLFIVVYVNITSPDMMKLMYETVMGRIIMTVCLVLYILAFILGIKLTDIEI